MSNTPRNELRRNETDWLQPIVYPPITEHAITRAAGGMEPRLIKRCIEACRRQANACDTRAAESKLPSAGRDWRTEADLLRATAKILERRQ